MSRSNSAIRSGLYRPAPHVLPIAKQRNCKAPISVWTIAVVLGVCTLLYMAIPKNSRPKTVAEAPSDILETRRQQRIKYGRVLRPHVKGLFSRMPGRSPLCLELLGEGKISQHRGEISYGTCSTAVPLAHSADLVQMTTSDPSCGCQRGFHGTPASSNASLTSLLH